MSNQSSSHKIKVGNYDLINHRPDNGDYFLSREFELAHKNSYDNHLNTIRSNCGKGSMLSKKKLQGGIQYYVHKVRCKSWYCEKCNLINSLVLRDRMKRVLKGKTWYLWTLTYSTQQASREDMLINCRLHFDNFMKAIRHRYPNVQYIKVLEFTKQGYPHYHVFFNCFLPFFFVQEKWIQSGGGFNVNFKKISHAHMLNYVCFYLSNAEKKQNVHNPQYYIFNLRRYSFSQNSKDPAVNDDMELVVYPCNDSTPVDIFKSMLTYYRNQGAKIEEKNDHEFTVTFCYTSITTVN